MQLDLHVYFHNVPDASLLGALAQLKTQGALQMATTQELVALANATAAEVAKFGPAVDALEAAVTAALAKIPTIPADAQADIDAAFATLQGAVSGAQAAVADAADGVDEAGLVVPPVTP
jgi:hypothetical protein